MMVLARPKWLISMYPLSTSWRGCAESRACVQSVPREGNGHAKRIARLRRDDGIVKLDAAEIIIVNSHAGTSAYQMFAGKLRLLPAGHSGPCSGPDYVPRSRRSPDFHMNICDRSTWSTSLSHTNGREPRRHHALRSEFQT